jgi:hypothetical protein
MEIAMKSALLLASLLVISLAGCNSNRDHHQVTVKSDSVQTGATIDIDRFGYDRKDDFQKLISARLEAVENGLKTLKTNSNLGTVDGSGTYSASQPDQSQISMRKNQIEKVQKQYESIDRKVGGIDDAKQADWDRVKEGFRNDLVQLESSYQSLMTSR